MIHKNYNASEMCGIRNPGPNIGLICQHLDLKSAILGRRFCTFGAEHMGKLQGACLMVAVNEAVAQVSLPLPSCSLYHCNQTILSTSNTSDAKEKPQDCRQPIQPTQGMQIPHRTRGTLMSFQHSPYPTPSASEGPSVLTRSRRRREQEAERPPYPHGSFMFEEV